MVIEEAPRAAPIFNAHGIKTYAIHPRAVTANGASMLQAVATGQATHVWAELPANGRVVPPRQLGRTLRELVSLMRRAARANCPAYLVAPRGRHWQQPAVQQLLVEGTVTASRHAACQLGIKDSKHHDNWSPVELHVYSTTTVPSTRCTCIHASNHAPWHEDDRQSTSTRQRREAAVTDAVQKTVQQLVIGSADTAVQQHMHVTADATRRGHRRATTRARHRGRPRAATDTWLRRHGICRRRRTDRQGGTSVSHGCPTEGQGLGEGRS